MLFSKDKRFVFVAVPKTGTTAIEERLLKIDPTLRHNEVATASGQWRNVPTHATAAEIRAIMGSQADNFTFVAFFRDPCEAIRSKYFFYRNGRPAQMLATGGLVVRKRPRDGKVSIGLALRIALAKILPLTVWAFLYPFKSGAHFVTDAEGRIVVDTFGDFDRLQEEVERIFGAVGYDPARLDLGIVNRSEYDRHQPAGQALAFIAGLKLPRDIEIYREVRQQVPSPAEIIR